MPTDRPRIEYFFSFISLWSYIGSLTFQDLVRRHNAEVVFKPIDLMAAFDAGGGKPVRQRPVQRQMYRRVEMERWKAIRGIPLVTWPKFYPADPSLGHRVLLAALRQGDDVASFAHAGLKAVWADELNIADPRTLVKLADANGLAGAKLLAQANDEEITRRETALTQEAVERQLFGAPFYFYRGEPFWGQDRLDLVEAAIVSGRPAILPLPISEL